MRILVTGSSGWLGQTLVPRLRDLGHEVVGIDPVAAPTTTIVGSIVDRRLVESTIGDHGIEAIVHAGALHKPHVALETRERFIAVNVQGTLNLLEAAVAPGAPVARFVFTSTTSLMISRAMYDGAGDGQGRAAWVTEDLAPLVPRNIYGVSKLAAEHLCRLFHEQHGLPLIVLRTARFFPEADDMAHRIEQSDENTKTNELLFRRLTVEDAAESHVVALDRAPEIGFDTFIVAAPTPFLPEDCADLLRDAPSVVARRVPQYRELYDRLGWTMFRTIDRVYDAGRIARRLGFVARTDFAARLRQLAR
ncbi:MAG: NAD(P)-dependent oxidoreductase [Geminicoccaceae bacterium]